MGFIDRECTRVCFWMIMILEMTSVGVSASHCLLHSFRALCCDLKSPPAPPPPNDRECEWHTPTKKVSYFFKNKNMRNFARAGGERREEHWFFWGGEGKHLFPSHSQCS